jgi:hypothetical protein
VMAHKCWKQKSTFEMKVNHTFLALMLDGGERLLHLVKGKAKVPVE